MLQRLQHGGIYLGPRPLGGFEIVTPEGHTVLMEQPLLYTTPIDIDLDLKQTPFHLRNPQFLRDLRTTRTLIILGKKKQSLSSQPKKRTSDAPKKPRTKRGQQILSTLPAGLDPAATEFFRNLLGGKG